MFCLWLINNDIPIYIYIKEKSLTGISLAANQGFSIEDFPFLLLLIYIESFKGFDIIN